MDVGKLVKLAPLMSRRLEDLTLDELKDIQGVLGLKVNVTQELKDAALQLLAGKDLDTVSDMIKSPESVQQLVLFLKGGLNTVAEADVSSHPDFDGVNSLALSFFKPA